MKQRIPTVNYKGKVRVVGTRQWRRIVGVFSDIEGGVRLDEPVDGFSLWNVQDLRYIPRRNRVAPAQEVK